MSASMHSFAQHLRKWVLEFKPGKILEWGPGLSTEIFLDCAPEARIISIEHQENWYNIAEQKFDGRVDLRLRKFDALNGRARGYATEPLLRGEGPFDMAFVDGRRRVECMLVASKVVRLGGIVILHDANRPEYRLGIGLFELVYSEDIGDTLAMRVRNV